MILKVSKEDFMYKQTANKKLLLTKYLTIGTQINKKIKLNF